MTKTQIVLITFSVLLAHNPENQKPNWRDYIRIGIVSDGKINQTGVATYYRIKRTTENTFRDVRCFGHFFDSSPEFRIRTKSSNKYDFNKNLYHFTTYVYHKSGKNLRYHFNQGLGAFLKKINNGNMTIEIGWAYDKSDYIDSDEKTTYLKGLTTLDKSWRKISAKIEIEYFNQISKISTSDLSRFETIFEFRYSPKNKWGITMGLLQENYINPQKINFRANPASFFISINILGFLN